MRTSEHVALRANFLKAFRVNLIEDIKKLVSGERIEIAPYPNPEWDSDHDPLQYSCLGIAADGGIAECEDAPGCGIEESLRPRLVENQPVALLTVKEREDGVIVAVVRFLDNKKEAEWPLERLNEDELLIVHREINRAKKNTWNI